MNNTGENKFTPLSEIGEFGLIKHLTENIELKHSSSVKGVGDDAAVLYYPESQILVTTDLLTEGIHFNLMYTPLKHLGYKAAVVNFSDIYAMNAVPRQIVVSLALSKKFSLEWVEELYSGILLACEKYNVDLVGGDTNSSLTGMTISITAIGEAKKEDIVYRNGAKENDLICVTGNLGAAYMGLQLLERELRIYESSGGAQPSFNGYDYVLERQLKPEARKDIIQILKEIEVKPTAMMDISDGLSSEILTLCNQSDKGCLIFQNKIPVDTDTIKVADEFNIEPSTCALNGGEDYELLFTVNIHDYDKIASCSKISIIGHILEDVGIRRLVLNDESELELKAMGWNAMKMD